MPKKILKRFLPNHQSIKDQKFLKIFGSLLQDPNLWHLNRYSVSGALGIGLFFCFWPVPIQMWLSATCAVFSRVNLPLSIATVWITNPFTMVPMFYGAYLVGTLVLGAPTEAFHFELSWNWMINSLETIGPAFLVGCAICSVIAGLMGYFGVSYLWRLSVISAWRNRKNQR
jgi:uncharacterized protein (DUF2062 family)